MKTNPLDFYPLDERNQKLLIELKHWDKEACISFLEQNVFPNIMPESQISDMVSQVREQSLEEIKTALIEIFQNVSPEKLFNPSKFN